MGIRKFESFLWWIVVSVSLCCSAVLSSGQINVTTFHYDNARTGQNTAETTLTPANVNSSQFGKLFSVTVDGYVYAQPLYMAKLSIAGGTHNVLYVATEHDSLYAIDADNGTVLWQQSFINPGAGITTVPSGDTACTDLVPEIGITSTPVIDPASLTIYVLVRTKESSSSNPYVQRLHALDLITHAEKFGGPVVITATAQSRTFDPLKNNQRAALLLENGHVILGWAGHCDNATYQGWVMSYNASTLAQEAAFDTAIVNGLFGGVWMSGDGIAADASGNVFLATGNGYYNGTSDFGNTILKLTGPSGGKFTAADWFTPWNWSNLNNSDTDLGSGGVLLLPTLTGVAHPQMLVQMGKDGTIHLIDRNTMGQICTTCTTTDTQIVQEIPGATSGIWGSPAFWNNTVYWGGGNDGGSADNITAWSFNANGSGLLSTSPVSQSAQTFAFSTAAPVISANGNSNGILWILDNSSFLSSCCQVLYAYDATNLGTMLYNSNLAGSRDVPGGAVKFTAPVVANGKVYVGSQGKVTAYGSISGTPTAAAPSFSPVPGGYTSAVTVTLSDMTSGATIHCTTDNTMPSANSPVCTTVTINSTTVLQAITVASGYNNSAVTSGTYTIGSGTGINFGGGLSSAGLTLNGSATINGTRLRITDGGSYEASSAFYSTPISVQNFTNDFSFQLTNAGADGMTFTIQDVGPTALGPLGGGLGYGPDLTTESPGIGRSVAVKFDLYSNNGEGNDSTGLYTNGVSPTIPAIDLTPSGVNLHSGDIFNVHMTYDGTTLTMTITDATTAQTFSTNWTINIPSTVGANTAYVGFTGGTGGLSAIQDILTWTYTTTISTPTAATPTFSPAPGTYSASQSVTLLDTTPLATIYYTTNGSTPTTSSTKYTTPITVGSSTTIQAIAAASGYTNSAVATGAYVISTNPSVNFANGFTATGMTFNSVAKLNGTRLRITDGGTYEATSAFYNTPLNVQSFTTNFSFQLTNPNADGFTFVIQNAGTTAVGPLGGGLGYGPDLPSGTPGIPKSVAVKFDLYSNDGEGSNSTGLYVNGASPTIPATALGGGVNLHSGDIFNVQLTYDGTTLTMTITDASVPADTFTTSWPISIPSTVGGNTAYAGFTGGTGGLTATQEITSWTYTSGVSNPPPPPPPPSGTPIVYQAESVPATGSPDARVFTWSGFTNGVGITVDGTQVGNSITFTLNVAQAGTYDVKYGTKLYPTRGIGQLSVSGVNVGPAVDQYSSNYSGVLQEFDVGNVTLSTAGNYQFTFTVTGKNAASSSYTLAFDYIKLTPQ